MPNFPNWTLSQQSRDRMNELLKSASELGLDPEAVAAGGLAALQSVIALKRAADAGKGAGRAQSITRIQSIARGIDPAVHGDLLQQIQSRVLALQGRGGDTEIAHVTPGEIVIPKALQTTEVMDALSRAASDRGIPIERMRAGAGENSINPETGAPEFSGGLFSGVPTPENQAEEVAAIPEGYEPVGEGKHYMRDRDGKIHFTPAWNAQVNAMRDSINWPGVARDLAFITASSLAAILAAPYNYASGAIATGLEPLND